MIITNKTRWPIALLERLVKQCNSIVRATDHSLNQLQVCFTQKHKLTCCSGNAYRGTNCFNISLPRPGRDGFAQAYDILETVTHELVHVRDYQANASGAKRVFLDYSSKYSARRINHDNRPQEKRAITFVKEHKREIESDTDLILDIALWIESKKDKR